GEEVWPADPGDRHVHDGGIRVDGGASVDRSAYVLGPQLLSADRVEGVHVPAVVAGHDDAAADGGRAAEVARRRVEGPRRRERADLVARRAVVARVARVGEVVAIERPVRSRG